MNINKLSGTKEPAVKSTGMLKSTNEITKLISNEYLKELELKEYCKIVESDSTKYQEKFRDLIGRKKESVRTKAEFKQRNKINVINSESLLKALRGLHKYKCELKLSYVTTEREMNNKKLRYSKIISDYESAWDKTLKKYNKMSFIEELHKIEEENEFYEKEIEKQVKLMTFTKTEYIQLKKNIEENFLKKVIKFSKLMTQSSDFLTSQKKNEKKQSLEAQITKRVSDFKLFRAKPPLLIGKSSNGKGDNSTTDNKNIFSGVDLSIFDNIMIPSENLECQNLEEEGYPFLQNDLKRIRDNSKDRLEVLEYLKNHREMMQSKNKRLMENLKENSMQDSAKASVVEENESHYFRQTPMEYLKLSQTGNYKEAEHRGEEHVNQGNNKDKLNTEDTAEKLKSINNATDSVLPRTKPEDDSREIQKECEESFSDGSYGKQYSIHKDIYSYQKTSSLSSEDLPPRGENENEGSVRKSCEYQENKNLKAQCETETNDLKSFTGFFTMGNDTDNATPSIFKLF